MVLIVAIQSGRSSFMSNRDNIRVAIIDYGMGNLFSVQRACVQSGFDAVVTHQKEEILNADGVIFPGVGAFGDAMAHLEKLDLIQPIKDFIHSGKPYFGICLGMQLLMSESEEFGIHKGLDIIPGAVKKLNAEHRENQPGKVPQVGWNQICPKNDTQKNWTGTPLDHLESGEYMYFVHSYHVKPADKSVVLSSTFYEGVEFCSTLQQDNIFAVQYHPEKSAVEGLKIYKNWLISFTN